VAPFLFFPPLLLHDIGNGFDLNGRSSEPFPLYLRDHRHDHMMRGSSRSGRPFLFPVYPPFPSSRVRRTVRREEIDRIDTKVNPDYAIILNSSLFFSFPIPPFFLSFRLCVSLYTKIEREELSSPPAGFSFPLAVFFFLSLFSVGTMEIMRGNVMNSGLFSSLSFFFFRFFPLLLYLRVHFSALAAI